MYSFLYIQITDRNFNTDLEGDRLEPVNDHFASIGSKIEQQIPHKPGNFKDYLNRKNENGKPFIDSPNFSFFLAPLSLVKLKI